MNAMLGQPTGPDDFKARQNRDADYDEYEEDEVSELEEYGLEDPQDE